MNLPEKRLYRKPVLIVVSCLIQAVNSSAAVITIYLWLEPVIGSLVDFHQTLKLHFGSAY